MKTFIIDGTSSAKKTTLLNLVSDQVFKTHGQRPEIVKTQSVYNVELINTFTPSTIGYITLGCELANTPSIKCNGFKLMDRSPLNPLEWRILWRCMDDFYKKHGNVYPTEEHLEEYTEIFKLLLNFKWYAEKRKNLHITVIVDSNVERCDKSRHARGEGSDVERSNWKFYTIFQNMMYKTLYPNNYIDLDELYPAGNSNNTNRMDFSTIIDDFMPIVEEMYESPIPVIQPKKRYKIPSIVYSNLSFDNTSCAVFREIIRMKRSNVVDIDREYSGPHEFGVFYKDKEINPAKRIKVE